MVQTSPSIGGSAALKGRIEMEDISLLGTQRKPLLLLELKTPNGEPRSDQSKYSRRRSCPGHPLGAVALRILVTLFKHIETAEARYGAAGICNGGAERVHGNRKSFIAGTGTVFTGRTGTCSTNQQELVVDISHFHQLLFFKTRTAAAPVPGSNIFGIRLTASRCRGIQTSSIKSAVHNQHPGITLLPCRVDQVAVNSIAAARHYFHDDAR